jgi:DNA-binding PadR family transcriptional regulator
MLKYMLLGLISQEPRYGYDLKNDFETLLGGTWPLNIGQIYTTLSRLERDNWVESEIVPQDLLPDRKVYTITPAGQEELDRWLTGPASESIRLKNEFFIKLLIHRLVGSDGFNTLIWKQRQANMQALAELTSLRSEPSLEPVTDLLIEGAILQIEADLKWLDICEQRLKEV